MMYNFNKCVEHTINRTLVVIINQSAKNDLFE